MVCLLTAVLKQGSCQDMKLHTF